MFGERELIVDLVVIIAAAAGGGVLASLLRLPVILGYLVAGLIVGHYIPGLDIEVARVQDIAELGVALLLFTLGVQFSFAELRDVRSIAAAGGLLQIVFTIGLGTVIGLAVGFEPSGAVLLGAVMALSSTMVALKLLDARGEVRTLHGRAAIGILLVQDLAVGPLALLIPAAAGGEGAALAGELGLAIGKAALLLVVAYILGTRIVPWLLQRVAEAGLREVFLLTVLTLGLGLAAGSFALGLGVAFGAFLAGLVVSESEFSYRTLADLLPLRDVFATIFFVSMGMLIEPEVLLDHPGIVLAVVAGLVAGKLVLTAVPVALLGYPPRTAALVGFALAQGGEFSFVLAGVGLDERLISSGEHSAILMGTLISIVLSPLLLAGGPRLVSWVAATPAGGVVFGDPVVIDVPAPEDLRRHVVVCGYGRVGRELVREVTRREFSCVVVEDNPYVSRTLRSMEIPNVNGDATSEPVLQACRLEHARLLAVTFADPAGATLILAYAKRVNPQIDVIVRGRSAEDYRALLEAGAAEVVQPEFEAGLEFVRHTLHRYGVDRTQIQALLQRRRRDVYQR
jgi:CPA2 family monovalent cation:H+ antiporter-2